MQNPLSILNPVRWINMKHIILTFLFFTGLQSFSQNNKTAPTPKHEISKTVYLTANTGLDESGTAHNVLKEIVKSSQNDEEAVLLVMGNLTRKVGYPKKKGDRKKEEEYLQKNLLDIVKDFNGDIILNPGENEWNKEGPSGLDDLESFLQDNSNVKFWPNDGCPIEGEKLSDEVELVMVDSQWFLEDWDKYPYLNKDCEIKTRKDFFIEFKDELKDAQGKTIIVSIHHPILSNTHFGLINKYGGFSADDFQNARQRDLHDRLEAIARQFKDVIFVSGNDRNLQYLDHHEVPQIISGAATSSLQGAKAHNKTHFAAKTTGYAKLDLYKDGSSTVHFYEVTKNNSSEIKSVDIARQRTRLEDVTFKPKSEYGETFDASIYTKNEINKSGLYKNLWGEHYRDIYGREISAPVLFLDDLPGNVQPISEGGGHQSRSLRLKNDEENEFTLRALRKSALRYLQHSVPGHYVGDILKNTVAERIVQDYYTTAHPYAPFAVNELMDDLELLHASPKIYYVPKQKALGVYNDEYGDELYMLEKHVGDENKDFKAFGDPDDILSTTDMLKEIQESKDAYVDEPEYLKARIFDMLIGDWDRHSDQWRWAEYQEENDQKRYEPIPRDRDQAFSKNDGPLIALLKLGVPALRSVQTFQEPIKSTKWFNFAANPLDNAVIQTSTWTEWEKQVQEIQSSLSDQKIDAAFAALPDDVQDSSIENIKKHLKIRRDALMQTARDYYEYFSKFQIVTGTDKDDEFLITRKPKGITGISITRKDTVIFEKDYDKKITKELWIYGLDGDDEFIIEGKGNNLINLKVLGGEENDIYDLKNKRVAKIYDYASKKNTFKTRGAKKWLVDSYDINTYDYNKRNYSTNQILPNLGYSSDSGVKAGATDIITTYGLANNPFRTQHTFKADYYFSTSGLELNYYGEFAHIFYNWNLGIDAYYTTPNFTLNYFGTGNDTRYDRDDVDLEYNRVNIEQWEFAPSLIWTNLRGSRFEIKPLIESKEVKQNDERFIEDLFPVNDEVFEQQYYAGGELGYQYINKENNPAFPNLGIQFDFEGGYKTNIDDHNNEFSYVKPAFSIDIPVHNSGVAVLASKVGGEFIFGDNYEFYHAATLGGNNSLRGFRNERFNGKSAFYHTTDLRVGLKKITTNFIPLRLGITLGYDYGRVWDKNDNSNTWHSDYGGSVFINGFGAFTGNIGYYISDEQSRIAFTFGFKF